MITTKGRNPSTKAHEDVYVYSYEDYCDGIKSLTKQIGRPRPSTYLCGIYRGGLVPAVHLSYKLALPLITLDWRSPNSCDAVKSILSNPKNNIIMVDEIIDSGRTVKQINEGFGRDFDWACLVFNKALETPGPWRSAPYHHLTVDRRVDDKYVIFHWENDSP